MRQGRGLASLLAAALMAAVFVSGCAVVGGEGPLDAAADRIVKADGRDERALRLQALAALEVELIAGRVETAAEVAGVKPVVEALYLAAAGVDRARAGVYFESTLSAAARQVLAAAQLIAGPIPEKPPSTGEAVRLALAALGTVEGARAGVADIAALLDRVRAGEVSYEGAKGAVVHRFGEALGKLNRKVEGG